MLDMNAKFNGSYSASRMIQSHVQNVFLVLILVAYCRELGSLYITVQALHKESPKFTKTFDLHHWTWTLVKKCFF